MFLYKVVEVKQKSFMRGIMKPVDLQNEINRWAMLGWTLDRITAGETAHLLLGSKDVFLLIFKKYIEIPAGLFLMINNQTVGPLDENSFGNLDPQNLVNNKILATRQGMNGWKPLVEVIPGIGELFL
jgi:Domain of unknown function (DUF4177)